MNLESPEFQYTRSEIMVGRPDKDVKVFIEDYVKSYIIKNLNLKGKEIEILFGNYSAVNNTAVINICGAATLPGPKIFNKKSYSLAKEIEKIGTRYFPGMETVGWIYSGKDGKINYSEMMDLHEKYFGEVAGLVITAGEKEDKLKIYSYTGDGFRLFGGYILYYDKNSEMQEYLLSSAHKKLIKRQTIDEVIKYINRMDKEKVKLGTCFVVMIVLFIIAVYEVVSFNLHYYVVGYVQIIKSIVNVIQ